MSSHSTPRILAGFRRTKGSPVESVRAGVKRIQRERQGRVGAAWDWLKAPLIPPRPKKIRRTRFEEKETQQ